MRKSRINQINRRTVRVIAGGTGGWRIFIRNKTSNEVALIQSIRTVEDYNQAVNCAVDVAKYEKLELIVQDKRARVVFRKTYA